MGRNGAGKSTTLKAIMGLVRRHRRQIAPRRHAASTPSPPTRSPARASPGCPQGRRLFAELTVAENLEIGLMTRHHGPATARRERAWTSSPACASA